MPPESRFPEHTACRLCNYSTQGLVGPTCPECGAPIDPDRPLTFWDTRSWTAMRRELKWVGWLIAIHVVVFGVGLLFCLGVF